MTQGKVFPSLFAVAESIISEVDGEAKNLSANHCNPDDPRHEQKGWVVARHKELSQLGDDAVIIVKHLIAASIALAEHRHSNLKELNIKDAMLPSDDTTNDIDIVFNVEKAKRHFPKKEALAVLSQLKEVILDKGWIQQPSTSPGIVKRPFRGRFSNTELGRELAETKFEIPQIAKADSLALIAYELARAHTLTSGSNVSVVNMRPKAGNDRLHYDIEADAYNTLRVGEGLPPIELTVARN